MDEIRDLANILDTVNAYLDAPPMRGTPEHRLFCDAAETLERLRREHAAGPCDIRLRDLGRRLADLTRRREFDRHLHDLGPQGAAMRPLVGGALH
jgi:hypothetical protein